MWRPDSLGGDLNDARIYVRQGLLEDFQAELDRKLREAREHGVIVSFPRRGRIVLVNLSHFSIGRSVFCVYGR